MLRQNHVLPQVEAQAFVITALIGPRQLSWRRFGPAAKKFPQIAVKDE